ncbi:MAG: lamin tail domain-containing protein [Pirellulaceae bacterium]|nr:lamin tail domain-containing protein [Pirellulaceae bacterium]
MKHSSNNRRRHRSLAVETLEVRLALDSTAVFNEVMYHPSGDEDSLEWIELHNQLSLDLDLTRWRLAGAVDYPFPDGTIIPGRGYLVIAVDPQELANQTGFNDALGPFTGRLSNAGEELQLLNNDDRLMSVLDYRDGGDWPVGPDGIGFTLAKRDELHSTADATHWTTSQELGGTPGAQNFVITGGPTSLELIDSGAQARYLIPTDNSLGTAWTAESFHDASWSLGVTGIGYEQTVTSHVAYGNLVGANGTSPLRGPYGHDFTVHSTITVTQLGVFDSGADGLSRNLTAELWTRSGNSGTLITDLDFTIGDPGVLTDSSRFKPLPTPVVLSPGDYTIAAHGFGSNEKAGHEGFGGPTSAFKTLDDGGGAISFVGTSRSGTTPGTFPTLAQGGTINYFSAGTFQFSVGSGGNNSEVATDIESVMSGVNTTAYVRVPFTVANAEDLSTLTLTMKYNDGFVAYINGLEVARRNAPVTPTWNSAAETALSIFTEEVIDVTTGIAHVQSGDNVLAIHGLNFGISDPRFLVLPELDAVESTDVSEVVINEVAEGSSANFFVEISNEATAAQPIVGYAIVSSTGDEYVIPNPTIEPGAYLSITANELGFTPADGDELFLLTPSRGRLADARHVTGRLRGRSAAHDNRWLYPTSETPDAANIFQIDDNIVINEILYNPFGQLPPTIAPNDLGNVTTTTLVSVGDQASVFIPNDDSLGTIWRQPGFNDSSWTTGPTGIGFETGGNAGIVAYGNLTGANGTSPLSGPYGHDFTVNSTISVTQLGVFDSGADGLDRSLTAEIWSRHSDASGTKLAEAFFTSGDPGTLIDSSRFKQLSTPLTLVPGEYTVVAHGFGSSEKAGDQNFGGPGAAFKTLNDGNGAISFVGESRLGTTVGTFPTQLINGSVNHFSAGTFQFSTGGFISQKIATDTEAEMHGENASAYLRVEFTATVPDVNQSAKLTLKLQHDDGYIAYLNGTEVARRNAPTVITFDASATIAEEQLTFQELDISAHVNQLVTGTNVLAIHGFNVSASDNDFLIVPKLVLEAAANPQDEWIELYNRGPSTVDLTGWKLDGGVEFDFPTGTTIAPDGYLVVAQNTARMATTYPGINVVGNFSGRLRNSQDLIQLVDANRNLADEVRYYEDSYWPTFADGGGSSLELRNPHADNSHPGAWAASLEDHKTIWNTYTYRGSATPFESAGTQFHELVIGLLDDGEILVDDITVVEDPDGIARQLIQNPTFESDTVGSEASTWRIIGNHFGTVMVDPDDANNQVLYLRSTGMTEDMHNHGETTFKHNGSFVQTVPGQTYEISFRARWLRGTNLFNTRLYYNSASLTTALPVPELNGTPGAQNSQHESNIGPTFSDLTHGPVVPDAAQSVTITVSASDPDDVASANVRWRTASGSMGPWQTSAMTFDGNGRLSGNIPGHSAGTVIQFYVEASDTLGATAVYPPTEEDSGALYKVQDNQAGSGLQHRLRIIQPIDDINHQQVLANRMSNHRLPGTIIVNESEVHYDVGIRLKGSSASRSHAGHGYNMRFQSINKYMGVHQNMSIDREMLDEMLIKQLNNLADGIPSMYNDSIFMIDPQTSSKNGIFILRMAGFGDVFLNETFRDGADGMLIDKDIDYRPINTTGGPEGGKLPTPWAHTSQGNADIGEDFWGTDKDALRLRWRTKNHRTRDDFRQIVQLNDTFRLQGLIPDDQWNDMLHELIDVDQWMRVLAMVNLAGVTDYLNQSIWNHNYLLYPRPDTGQMVMLPWDLDIAYGSNAPLIGTGPHMRTRALVRIPENLRLLYGHYDHLIDIAYNGANAYAQAGHLNMMFPGTDFTGPANYIASRATSLASQLPAAIPFQITTTGPLNAGSDGEATITGEGWVDVREIRLSGTEQALDVQWTAGGGASYAQTWSTVLSLTNGTNDYTVEAYDHQGNLIASDLIQITTTGGDDAVNSLRITEINFNPAAPTTAELAVNPLLDNDDFEFIEVQNIGAHPLNLQNVAFLDGIEFTFPTTMLAAGQYGLAVKDTAAFQVRYGAGANILGEFTNGQLSNNGEQIQLAVGATDILSFSYDDAEPWPERSDGNGSTLEIIDPVGTPVDQFDKFYRWRPSNEYGGTPGAAGHGPVGVVINEILMSTDSTVLESDSIELHNTTTASIDISDWYLSDSSENFMKFQIPGGTVLGAGQYIVFDEADFNPHPGAPGPNDFALNGTEGDEVWLIDPNGGGPDALWIIDEVRVGASIHGESWGRSPNGSGRLAPMETLTLGSINAMPRVGPVVISEVNYHPAAPSLAALAFYPSMTDNDLEFVEVFNPMALPVDLSDWRIRGNNDFDFTGGTILPPGESLIVTSFDPDSPTNTARRDAFRAHYGIDTSVILVGGFSGQLGNGTGRIELQRPGDPTPGKPGVIPRLLEDEILYDDLPPWPPEADGTGNSLNRFSVAVLGTDDANWTAPSPSPGLHQSGLLADLNVDQTLSASDIDLLFANLGSNDSRYDLDIDGDADREDVDEFVENILATRFADTDLDQDIDIHDFNNLALGFDPWGQNAFNGWANGNFDGDNDVDIGDFRTLVLNFAPLGFSSLIVSGIANNSPLQSVVAGEFDRTTAAESSLDISSISSTHTSSNPPSEASSSIGNPVTDNDVLILDSIGVSVRRDRSKQQDGEGAN